MINGHCFSMNFTIHSYECDHAGIARLQSICNYLQETAGIHAEKLHFGYDDMVRHQTTWVLIRLTVKMLRYPRWKDIVKVETWPSELNNYYAYRDFRILDQTGNEIGRATSQWGVLHLTEKKLVKPTSVGVPEGLHQNRAFFPKEEKIPVLNHEDHVVNFTVRRSDLDMNRHVNNVRYIEWALEAVPAEWVSNKFPVYLDIVFRSETFYGQTVCSAVEKSQDSRIFHLITNHDKEVIRAVSEWEPLKIR